MNDAASGRFFVSTERGPERTVRRALDTDWKTSRSGRCSVGTAVAIGQPGCAMPLPRMSRQLDHGSRGAPDNDHLDHAIRV